MGVESTVTAIALAVLLAQSLSGLVNHGNA